MKKKIVVIGGGFAGLNFCRHFKNDSAAITLIDKRNHHLFLPLLYQVATTGLSAPDIAQPLRSILSGRDDITVQMDTVTSIDLSGRRVICLDKEFDYDYLVLAAGSETNYFGNPQWEEHAYGLKSLGDAHRIRNSVIGSFEKAENNATSKEETKRLMTTVIIGAGPTGLEMAGTLAELYRKVFRRDYRTIRPEHARVVLLDAMPRVLPPFSEKSSDAARKQLEALGVEIKTNNKVKDIKNGQVILEDETIEAANIIWTAGVSAPSFIQNLEVEKDKSGRPVVQTDCSLPSHPEVFVIGDIASVTDKNGKKVPGLAPAAIQMGKHTAKAIAADLNGNQRRPQFAYFDKGMLATIGRAKAVGEVRGKQFSGWFAWLVWLVVHLAFLQGFRNRAIVLLQWFFAYITFKPGSRILWRSKDQ